MSDDPEQEYLADGITENIITALSKIPEIFVIARRSTFTYKGKAVKVQKVSEELGVRHVLEGSVQKSGERVRVSAQLVDATTGHHLWSDQYDRYVKDLFALQDEITHKIVVALQVELTEGEQAHVRHRSTNNLKAWGCAVRGYSLFERYNKEDNAKARDLFKRAVKIDPKYAWAWTWLAYTHWIDARFGFSESRPDSFKRAVDLAQKALSLDESDPDAHALLGAIYLFQRQHEKAIVEGKKAIALGPNNAENHALLAMTMFHAGRFEEAIGLGMKAMRLSPHYPSWYLLVFGAPNLFLGRYEEAIDAFESCLERSKKEGGAILILAHCYLAATYSELGRVEEARVQASEVLNINPKFSLEWVRKASFLKDPVQLGRFLDALRKAGLK
ncbi:MAG: tetratricopeptide repeat protein [Deltaproteobacteria bacterium]|nr:tetratricopeptide repeat protein [Deltaproteobacteria bacterium]